MRKNIVAGNWKMNTTLQEGVVLASGVNNALKGANPKCDVIIAVPFTHLAPIAAVIDQNILGLGAENCADHKSGAYTGEVSASMVASTVQNTLFSVTLNVVNTMAKLLKLSKKK